MYTITVWPLRLIYDKIGGGRTEENAPEQCVISGIKKKHGNFLTSMERGVSFLLHAPCFFSPRPELTFGWHVVFAHTCPDNAHNIKKLCGQCHENDLHDDVNRIKEGKEGKAKGQGRNLRIS